MSELNSLTRESRFIRTMRQRYANDRLALRIILGQVADGSYERAREAFKQARGVEALVAFDHEAQLVYRAL